MIDHQIPNLDYLAAKHAQAVVKAGADENTLTKALGVLQENGVYACFLYLLASDDKFIHRGMLGLLKALEFEEPPESEKKDKILEYVAEKISADLPRLLLAKETLEQMLIYARFGARARA